jgi:hypothetical protein
MDDILIIKSNAFLPREQLQNILNCLKAQKETGIILLPSYLEARVVPDNIEVKLADVDEII